ncbi:hypothetical protein KFL_010170055 [Klebsormidium nitens]|uniref:mRNA (guanine-N(7))-methyltransferase n=1 Tax=Klebsormidium nitens TaxID=105231 RepID=A0A1Y1IUU3_KLENI|nr:hypothetical protein KFL_010170055 [Klebsormidium nitens]|eukprot:GAQ92457.1 hypothetical protein KFL_010170055 [Klebsormidium nitens]
MEGLRAFHNVVKETLLSEALSRCRNGRDLKVLDLACGCLGDVHKYDRTGRIRRVVGLDVDGKALEEAERRSRPYAGRMDVSLLPPIDCRDLDLASEALGGERFDLLVCNFAVQYFTTGPKETARFACFIKGHLDGPRSIFIGCAMNGDKVDLISDASGTFANDIIGVQREGETFAVAMNERTRYYAKQGASISEPIFRPESLITGALESGLRLLDWRSFAEYDVAQRALAEIHGDGLEAAARRYDIHVVEEFLQHLEEALEGRALNGLEDEHKAPAILGLGVKVRPGEGDVKELVVIGANISSIGAFFSVEGPPRVLPPCLFFSHWKAALPPLIKRQRGEGPSVVAPIQGGLVEAHAQATANYESQIEKLQARIDGYERIQNQTDNELRRERASREIVNSQLTESKRHIKDLEKDIERIRREGRKTEDKLQNELDYEKRSRKVQMDKLEKERSAEMKKSLAEQAEKHRKREEELRKLREEEKKRYEAKVDELRKERDEALARQKELSEAAEAKRAIEIEDLEGRRRRAEEEVKKLKEELQKKEHEREEAIAGWSHVRKGLTLANQQLNRENADLQTAREEAIALMDRLRTVYKNLPRRAFDLPRRVETQEELTDVLESLIKDLNSDRSRQSNQLDDIFRRVTRAVSNFRGFCERAENRVNIADSNDIQTMIGNLENSLTHAQNMHEGARETILGLERTAETRKRDLERALRDLDDLLSGTVRADASEQVKTIKDRLDAAREEARAFGKAAARAEELRRAKAAEAERTGAQLASLTKEVRRLNAVVAHGNEREESMREKIRDFEKLCRDVLVSQEHREQLLNHADPKLREVGSIVKTLLDSKETLERALQESRERESARMELDDEIEELKTSKRALERQNAELMAKASDLRDEVQRSNAEHEHEKSRITADYQAREAAWQRSAQNVSRDRETWMQGAKSEFEQIYAERVRELDGFRAQAAAEVDAHRADRVALEGRVRIAEQKAIEDEQNAEQRIAEIGAQVRQIDKNYTRASEEKQRELEELNV